MVQNVVSLVKFQLFSRLMSFVINNMVLRTIDSVSFGLINVRMEFFLSTVLFLSREGIRQSAERMKLTSFNNEEEKSQLFTLSLIPLLIGIPFVIFTCSIYLLFPPEEVDISTNFICTLYFSFSCLIELSSEPYFNSLQVQKMFSHISYARGAALLVKSLVTAVLIFSRTVHPVIAMSLAQVSHSVVLWVALFLCSGKFGAIKLHITSAWLKLSWRKSKQSLIGHFLNQGDLILLSLFSSLETQGKYSIASHYASIVVRLLFTPITEASRTYFSQIDLNNKDTARSAKQTKNNALETMRYFEFILKSCLYLALLLISVGYNNTDFAVKYILGSKWLNSSLPHLLSLHCILLGLLATNGITEGFMQSTMEIDELHKLDRRLIFFSMAYSVYGWIFVRYYEAQGLIISNCINSLIRIFSSWKYCMEYRRTSQAEGKFFFPRTVIICAAIGFLITSIPITNTILRLFIAVFIILTITSES